jgi:hypothetical protein
LSGVRKKVCVMTSVHRRDDTRILSREARSLAKVYDVTLLVADGLPSETVDGVFIRSVVDRKPRSRPERMIQTADLLQKTEMAALIHPAALLLHLTITAVKRPTSLHPRRQTAPRSLRKANELTVAQQLTS